MNNITKHVREAAVVIWKLIINNQAAKLQFRAPAENPLKFRFGAISSLKMKWQSNFIFAFYSRAVIEKLKQIELWEFLSVLSVLASDFAPQWNPNKSLRKGHPILEG